MRFQTFSDSKNINYEKIYLYLFIVFAFTLPNSRAAISFFTIILPLIWLFEGDFKRKFEQIKENKVIISLFLFTLLIYLSLFWTEAGVFKDGFGFASKGFRIILIFMIITITSLKIEHISKVITAFLMGMLVSEVLSYGIFFELWILPFGSGTPSDPTPFMHHLDYSTFLAFTSLLLLNSFFYVEDFKLKIFYFVYFLFVTSNLFLNGGRTGQFAFLVTILIVGFLNIKNKLKALLTMLVILASILIASYNFSPVFKDRFYHAKHEIMKILEDNPEKYTGSFGHRVGFWIVGFDVVKDKTILGTGAGSEEQNFKKYLQNHPILIKSLVITSGEYHNQFIQIVVRLGIIGLMLYLSIWYFIGKLKIYDKNLSNLRYIFMSVFITASLFENIFENQFTMAMFAMFVSIFIIFSKQNKMKKE